MNKIILGDCLEVLRSMPDKSVDLVLGSPPYEDARTYGIGFSLKGQEWVDWMVARWTEMQRVSRGLVVMVVEGKTRNFRWSATPAILMADLHRAGLHLRKPPAYHRVGIPGSGGPDFFRNDYEFCVVTCRPGKSCTGATTRPAAIRPSARPEARRHITLATAGLIGHGHSAKETCAGCDSTTRHPRPIRAT